MPEELNGVSAMENDKPNLEEELEKKLPSYCYARIHEALRKLDGNTLGRRPHDAPYRKARAWIHRKGGGSTTALSAAASKMPSTSMAIPGKSVASSTVSRLLPVVSDTSLLLSGFTGP